MFLGLNAGVARAQTTAFTYQGKLSESNTPANGQYDFQFKLYDTATVGTGAQQGAMVPVANVTVTAGIFTVQLDFGACASCFNGSPRFLEIAVKQTSGSTFTTLGPRQPLSSTPYAIRSLNSATADGLSVACVNCVTSSQIQSVQGAQVSGAIPLASLPAGSANYIQNGTTQQATSNFNISGIGLATIFDAATQYNFAGQRVLGVTGSSGFPNSNLFVGPLAGAVNGINGIRNTFVGASAGANNTIGTANSFFGALAGEANVSGGQNSFFGRAAGRLHQSGSDNAFFGAEAGGSQTSGCCNAFFGTFAGLANVTGGGNTMLGYVANLGAGNLSNATAIGYRAYVTQNNSLVLGSINGINGATADTNVGIGTTTPAARLHVVGDGLVTGNLTVSGTMNANLSSDIVNATTQYNVNGSRVLGVGGNNSNLFVGIGAGAATSGGFNNSFFGRDAGLLNTTGSQNSFFGMEAGKSNSAGTDNAFFGSFAGTSNVTGVGNSFFGSSAGEKTTAGFNAFFGSGAGYENTTGTGNSFFGSNAGQNNTANDNSFFGREAGFLNTVGTMNAFFGQRAGRNNTASGNAFFGFQAGLANTTGVQNAFFGYNAGQNNQGSLNAFFGYLAGAGNTSGSQNTFSGNAAGAQNTTGSFNAFFGNGAGVENTTGVSNTFFGISAGSVNATGTRNTLLGGLANVGSDNLTNAAAIGYRALVSQNNSLVLGGINGVNNCTATNSCDSVNVGIGTTTPAAPLHLQRDGNIAANWQNAQLRISGNTDANMQLNLGYDTTNNRGVIQAGQANVNFKDLLLNPSGGNVGIGTASPEGILHVRGASPVRILADLVTLSGSEYVDFMARNSGFASDLGGLRVQRQPATGNIDTLIFASPNGNVASEKMRISGTGNVGIGVSAPSFKLQVNGSVAGVGPYQDLSDRRYKRNIEPLSDALAKVLRLRGVSFDWRQAEFPEMNFGKGRRVGFIAQEVEGVLPEAVVKDERGVYTVAYASVTPLLVEAIKEQQKAVEQLKRENADLREEGHALRERLTALEQMMKRLIAKPPCGRRPARR
jgi:hypothetical protein